MSWRRKTRGGLPWVIAYLRKPFAQDALLNAISKAVAHGAAITRTRGVVTCVWGHSRRSRPRPSPSPLAPPTDIDPYATAPLDRPVSERDLEVSEFGLRDA